MTRALKVDRDREARRKLWAELDQLDAEGMFRVVRGLLVVHGVEVERGTGYAWSHRLRFLGKTATSTGGEASAISNWIITLRREFET